MKTRNEIRQEVRENYASVAQRTAAGDCGCGPSSCCGDGGAELSEDLALEMGYTREDLAGMPEGANMGLGCGNPQAIASLRPGQTVLDLGSGGGFDCFLAARKVGEEGRVIGVDMTPEMLSKARANAERGRLDNVEFRLGEIERLPLADGSVDVILSNCVINLSPDKPAVFREAYRVLRPGGRLAVSDVVAAGEIPAELLEKAEYYSACITGAASVDDLESMIAEAGFVEIRIRPREESRELIRRWSPGRNLEDVVISASIEALKSAG